MASLDMKGPFQLTDSEVDRQVTRRSPGNYGLGYVNDSDTFIVQYVGRSDDDVNSRLHDWTGTKYQKFKYSYASSAKEAFEKECRNYHDFGGSKSLDNDMHPDRPNGTTWRCPVCGQ
ncbi:MAG: hypothetical protein G8D88_16225 [gamma proteobacterium symbiont of Ctena orbiculata]